MWILSPSQSKTKKYIAENTETGKKVTFGHKAYEDFTIHRDLDRRARYIQRHQKNENFDDSNTAGFWAANILWNKPTVRGSITDTQRKHNIKIKLMA